MARGTSRDSRSGPGYAPCACSLGEGGWGLTGGPVSGPVERSERQDRSMFILEARQRWPACICRLTGEELAGRRGCASWDRAVGHGDEVLPILRRFPSSQFPSGDWEEYRQGRERGKPWLHWRRSAALSPKTATVPAVWRCPWPSSNPARRVEGTARPWRPPVGAYNWRVPGGPPHGGVKPTCAPRGRRPDLAPPGRRFLRAENMSTQGQTTSDFALFGPCHIPRAATRPRRGYTPKAFQADPDLADNLGHGVPSTVKREKGKTLVRAKSSPLTPVKPDYLAAPLRPALGDEMRAWGRDGEQGIRTGRGGRP